MDLKSVSVLICEDDDISMDVLDAVLRGVMGVSHIYAFENPTLAKECLNKIDLIITDNDMPRMSGLEFIDWLNDSPYREIPILLVSGHINNKIREKAKQRNFAYMGKPYDLEELKNLILRLIKK